MYGRSEQETPTGEHRRGPGKKIIVSVYFLIRKIQATTVEVLTSGE
jgi:hypothetical protein